MYNNIIIIIFVHIYTGTVYKISSYNYTCKNLQFPFPILLKYSDWTVCPVPVVRSKMMTEWDAIEHSLVPKISLVLSLWASLNYYIASL